jgi:hypothetical protein
MKKLTLLLLAGLSMSGCVSTGGSTKFYDDPALLSASGGIRIRNVEVVVDHVPQKDVERQLRQIAESMIDETGPAKSGGALYADIEVQQRSFIEGIDPKTSLYLTILVSDQDGRDIFRVNRYAVGNESIISSAVQRAYLSILVDSVNRERRRRAKAVKGS